MPKHGYLMTPGPTPIPPEVEAAMALPIVYHRSAEFEAVVERVLARLSEVFRGDGDIVLLTCSGTGAMESAVANLCSPGDRVLVVSAGNFGERWAKIAAAFSCDVAHLRYTWGDAPDPAEIAGKLEEIGGAKVVFCTHSETSTGVVSDVRAIAEEAKRANALTVVDAISSLGAVPLEQAAWGVDVVVSGSQKALMTPPGLAFASISGQARKAARVTSATRFYLDWERSLVAQAAGRTPFTPAVSLVRGLDAALDLLLADGLEAAWERSMRLGKACRAGVKAMGLDLFSPDDDAASVVTAITVPDGVDGSAIVRSIREEGGVTLAGGQGELKGRILRIGHIGYVGIDDVAGALEAVEGAFAAAGVKVGRGVAAGAARATFAERAVVAPGS